MRYVLTGALLLIAGSTPTEQDVDAATLVARVGAFFVEHEPRLTGLIAEERQTQRQLTPGGKVSKTRVLVSDAMFVTVGDRIQYFRDVMSVDGKVSSPTMARGGAPLQDMAMRGSLTIDPATGAIRAATIGARHDIFDGLVQVRYGDQAGPAALVPVHVSETYRFPIKPKNDYLEIVSEYSNIRRFEVSVEQTIELPK